MSSPSSESKCAEMRGPQITIQSGKKNLNTRKIENFGANKECEEFKV